MLLLLIFPCDCQIWVQSSSNTRTAFSYVECMFQQELLDDHFTSVTPHSASGPIKAWSPRSVLPVAPDSMTYLSLKGSLWHRTGLYTSLFLAGEQTDWSFRWDNKRHLSYRVQLTNWQTAGEIHIKFRVNRGQLVDLAAICRQFAADMKNSNPRVLLTAEPTKCSWVDKWQLSWQSALEPAHYSWSWLQPPSMLLTSGPTAQTYHVWVCVFW